MALARDRSTQPIFLSFEEFLAQYGDDNRYELIDGELFDLEPTGPHEEVAAAIARWLNGRPKQPPLTVCILNPEGRYDRQLLRGDQRVVSSVFPNLNLTAKDILRVG